MLLTNDDIQAVDVVIVRYNSGKGGKHNKNDDWCVPWSQVPEDDHDGEQLPTLRPVPVRRIADGVPQSGFSCTIGEYCRGC